MRELLLVAVGGAVGAMGRYGVGLWARARFGTDFPWGTFVVNVAGSLLLGFLMGLALSGRLDRHVRSVLATGFCGAFTTFSTFSFETLGMMREGKMLRAGANLGVSVALGLVAAMLGLWMGQRCGEPARP